MSEASAVPDLTVHTMYPPDSGAIAAGYCLSLRLASPNRVPGARLAPTSTGPGAPVADQIDGLTAGAMAHGHGGTHVRSQWQETLPQTR